MPQTRRPGKSDDVTSQASGRLMAAVETTTATVNSRVLPSVTHVRAESNVSTVDDPASAARSSR